MVKTHDGKQREVNRVDLDLLMLKTVEQWTELDAAEHAGRTERLKALFTSRFKPGEPIPFAEFERAVAEVGGPDVSRRKTLELFSEAVDASSGLGGGKEGHITLEQFVRVVSKVRPPEAWAGVVSTLVAASRFKGLLSKNREPAAAGE